MWKTKVSQIARKSAVNATFNACFKSSTSFTSCPMTGVKSAVVCLHLLNVGHSVVVENMHHNPYTK